MTFPLVLDLAADGIPVAVTCRVLGFSRQAFYAWTLAPVSDRDLVDAYATNAALQVHADDPGFGYRFIADELADAGHRVSERRVWRLCQQARIVSCTLAHAAGRARIVGYSIDERMTSRLAVDALQMAVARRGGAQVVAGCVVHSDRGSQFRSRRFVHELARQGLSGSMGRVASSADNAAMESFFALPQKNVLDARPWATRHELRLAIVTWIERTYHRRRRQRSPGKLTPIESETMNRATHPA